MTGHASKLSRLQTGVNCWVTTRLLSHLLKLNPLEQLKYLRYKYLVLRWYVNSKYLSQDRLHQKPLPHCFISIVEKCKVIGVSDWSWNMAEHGSKVRNISWEQSSSWVLFTAFVRRWMWYLRTRTYSTDWLVMIIVKIFFEKLLLN